MDREVIGRRLRRHREQQAMTREEFSERIEISPQFLAEIENGTKGMSAETLYKICERAAMSADYLLLGRQSVGSETPIAEMLYKIPPKYTETIEKILSAYLETIDIAGREK